MYGGMFFFFFLFSSSVHTCSFSFFFFCRIRMDKVGRCMQFGSSVDRWLFRVTRAESIFF